MTIKLNWRIANPASSVPNMSRLPIPNTMSVVKSMNNNNNMYSKAHIVFQNRVEKSK